MLEVDPSTMASHDSFLMWLYLKKAGTNQQVMKLCNDPLLR